MRREEKVALVMGLNVIKVVVESEQQKLQSLNVHQIVNQTVICKGRDNKMLGMITPFLAL